MKFTFRPKTAAVFTFEDSAIANLNRSTDLETEAGVWLLQNVMIGKTWVCVGIYAQRGVILFGSVPEEFQFESRRESSDFDPILVEESRCVAIGS